MPKTAFPVAACVAAVVLLAAGCGHSTTPASSASSTAKATGAKFVGCMVADDGTIDDRSFNQSAWSGMQAAAAADPLSLIHI